MSSPLGTNGVNEQKEILTLPPRSVETQLERETRLSSEGKPGAEIRDDALGAGRWVGRRI